MRKNLLKALFCISLFLFSRNAVVAQLSNQPGVNGVATYINAVQPEDNPDQTLMKVGNDFYSTGSSFHFTPYVSIRHSTDLVHWEVISRVVPSNWSGLASDATAAGIWEGALANFGGYFWVYYSNTAGGGQYFSKATNMAGPWSAPTKVTGSTVTGYDNSIFVDDDGTPYMLMKNGQSINRIQQIDKTTGQVTGTLMNMDWINANNRYSWAEGPVMCKRNGRYYYFMAGDVSGGQYCMSSATLTATESSWTLHGNFFSAATSPGGFTGPNHISQPVQIADGTWWCLSHAYDNSGWYGQGRQSLLHQVIFDSNGVPHGVPPNTNPVGAPNLPSSNISINLPRADYFTSSTLAMNWHFFNKTNATKYSLTANPGYLRLTPGTGTTHILQKEGGHYYSMVTKVNVNATATGNQAGLRIMNGKDILFATLYAGNNGGQKIGFAFNGTATEVNNTIGNVVWLKIERTLHNISGFYSGDGKTWTQIGGAINISTLDNYSTNYNEWVGTSVGLYATGVTADFDSFMYRDGFSPIKVVGHNNHYGVTTSTKTPGSVVSNSVTGDWLALAGVSIGQEGVTAGSIQVNAASASGTGSIEVWIDNIGGTGTQIATIPITSSGGADVWKDYTANINASGQHDVYLRFIGAANSISVNTIRFIPGTSAPMPVVSIASPANNTVYTDGDNITINANASITTGSISNVEFYQGTTLLGSDASSPYTFTWNTVVAGNYFITAKATSSTNSTTTSSPITIQVAKPVYQTGTPPVIDGTVEGLWNNFPSIAVTHVNSGVVSSATDLSGNWKAAWDATNLYVLVQVTDDVKRNDAGTDVYNDDNVEVYVDMGNTKATTYGTDDQQYTFRWNDATAAYEINGHSVAGITKGMTNTATGYIMEMSIPWSTIGGTAAINNLEGFEIMINDDDDGGARDGKMAWIATTDDTWSNPSLMGTILLKGLNCTAPAATITTSGPTTFCAGGSVILNASTGTGYTYVWKNGTTTIAGATASSYTATTAGSYSVTVTSSGCSTTSTSTVVTVNALPIITPYSQVDGGAWNQTSSSIVCSGSSIVLGPQPTVATGWSWTGPNGYTSTSREITLGTLTTTQAGNYTATYTDGNGCKASSVFTLTVNALPSAPAVTATRSYCQNSTATALSATGTNLKWYSVATGGTASTTAPTPTTASAGTTNYYVSQTTNNCEGPRAMIAVTVNALPSTPTVSSPVIYCQNATAAQLSATGTSLKWYSVATGGTASTTAPTPTTASAGTTNYYVSQTTNNCEGPRVMIAVTVNALPLAPTVSSPVSYCQNATATALAASGTSLLWYTNSTGGTGSSIAPTPSTSTSGTTNYYVSQTLNGCEGSRALIAVSVNSLPTSTIIAGGNTSFCQGGSVILTGSAGTSYVWFNGASQVGIGSTYTATTAGNYSVEVTNASGCKATSSATTVTINTLPTASISTGGPTTFIQGGSVVLSANTGTDLTYIWFNGPAQVGTGSTYTASSAGNYTVEVTNAAGCKATSAVTIVTVNGNQAPVVNITFPANNATFTTPANVTLTATATDVDGTVTKVDFYSGNTLLGTDPTSPYDFAINNLSDGSYTIIAVATDNLGATTTSTPIIFMVSNPLPTVSITAPSNGSSYVENATVTISAVASDGNGAVTKVEFYNGSTLLGTDVSFPYSFTWSNVAAGTYDITAKATDNDGGEAISSIVSISVTGNQPSVISITSPAPNTTIVGAITITANVTDPDGGITLVEFLDGTTVIGTSTTAPYSYTWVDPTAGDHQISVRVTDSNGGVTTSTPILVTSNISSGIQSSMKDVNGILYPNPAVDEIYVEAEMDFTQATLEVVNIVGEVVMVDINISIDKLKIDLNGLAAGSYVITIKQDNAIMRKKFIVIK